jgi:preprotein translocase subunit SecE
MVFIMILLTAFFFVVVDLGLRALMQFILKLGT